MQAVGLCISAVIMFSETSYYFNMFMVTHGQLFLMRVTVSTPRRVGHICFYICLDAKFWSHRSYSLSQFLPDILVYTWGWSDGCSSFHGHPVCHENTMVLIYLIFSIFLHSSIAQKASSFIWLSPS